MKGFLKMYILFCLYLAVGFLFAEGMMFLARHNMFWIVFAILPAFAAIIVYLRDKT